MSVSEFHWKSPSPNFPGWTAGSLALPLPPLSEAIDCGGAFNWFIEHPDQHAAAVIDADGMVKGIVNRLRFLSLYARRFYPELYSRHSILKLANENPLVVDRYLPVADLGATVAIEQPDALIECFVVTEKGRYFGIGTGEALMRCKVDLLTAHQEDLKHTLVKLSEANKAKSNFLAMMSHELRTPLNAIIGFSEVIAGEVFGAMGSDRYKSYVNDIHGAGRHLLALINDILDLSKTEAGKLELRCEAVDLGAVVEESVYLIKEKAQSQGIDILTSVPAGLPEIFADKLRMKQILINLLSNAVKFTELGYVEAAVERRPAGELVLRVTDTGIGMAPEMIPAALEPFRQIDSALSRKFEGTGLGLTLVKSLVESHDGRLEIESTLNKGTTVRAVFPPGRVCVRDRAQCV